MKQHIRITSAVLHILAMFFMLMDHLWSTLLPTQRWMTGVGRIAFPIFAFLIVEGFLHTSNIKRYMLRIFLFACISEIPFNLIYGGTFIYPVHQNVLWTFLISLFCLYSLKEASSIANIVLRILASIGIIFLGFLLGTVLLCDFYGPGILTVLTFYLFRRNNWISRLGQLVILYWINFELLGGLCYQITILGYQLEIVEQGIAILALIPIWLYNGEKGYSSKFFQYFCYAFYPLHCVILYFIALLLQNI